MLAIGEPDPEPYAYIGAPRPDSLFPRKPRNDTWNRDSLHARGEDVADYEDRRDALARRTRSAFNRRVCW